MRLKERIQNWFYSRGRLQIFSLLVAFVAWFVVHSGQTVQQRIPFNIEYINMPSHLIFKKDPPKEIRVLLTGSFHRVRGISSENVNYVLDLAQARPGLNTIDIDLGNLRLPLDVFASNPVPRRVDFQLEELQRKEVPVSVEFVGQPAEGFVVSSVQVTPNPVQLVGPASSLEGVQELSVRVPLDRKQESFSTSVLLQLDLPQTKTVEGVLVEVNISRVNQEREISQIPVVVEGADSPVKVIPAEARLVLRGTEDKLAKAKDRSRVLVPVKGLGRGRYRVRARVELEDGVKLVSLQPESFIVEVLGE